MSELSRTLQALSDPTRREILRILGQGDKNAGEIARQFDMTLPSVSHHLGVLKSANLVQAERAGQNIIYSLNSTVMQEALQQLFELFQIRKPDADTSGDPS